MLRRRHPFRTSTAAATAPLAALALVGGLVTGCGEAGSPPSGPTGVDGLVVPTPAPDPADFVAAVDNPWLPLEPGTTWTYLAGPQPVVVTAERGPQVAGVATTALVRTRPVEETAGAVPADDGETTDYYAQDTAGNVWWFGRAGEWEAGTGGAEAGLAMPAEPRVGDGYRVAQVPGRTLLAEVLDLEEREDVPAGPFEGLLEVRAVVDGTIVLEYYARGTGLVASRPEAVGAPELELESVDPS